MKFTATIFAVAFAAGMAAAMPGHPDRVPSATTTTAVAQQTGTNNSGSCAVGKPQCCSTVLSEADASKQADFLGLSKVVGAVGLQCQHIPVNIIGVAAELDNECKSTPVCCQDTAQNGLIHTGCTPINVN